MKNMSLLSIITVDQKFKQLLEHPKHHLGRA